uniref:DCD domain-containing protein n=1 Tax=Davidia involucrata TaxID=16924 RepID=A0A5B6Z172_DAVIN
MESIHSFWQLSDELRGQSKVSEDHKWLVVASKLAEQTSLKGERRNNLDLSKGSAEIRPRDNVGLQEDNKFESLRFNMLNLEPKMTENVSKSSFRNGICNMNTVYQKSNGNNMGNMTASKYSGAITPGLPLFLYNYTTHQLHGIFEAVSFGGSNIDPTAWEDKKCKGESRFPAQVRIRVRKLCKALEEDAFRPVLHHYDGPKFRLELSVPETLDLLDLCEQAGGV